MSTRTEARSPTNVAGAIYGQVLASSEVAALSLDKELDSAQILAALTGTMLVFWLAHVYAHTVADRLSRPHMPRWADLRLAMGREWPMLLAAVPAAIALLLGVVGVFSTGTAATLAIILGVLNLFLWGVAIARRSMLGWAPTLTAGGVTAAFGLAVEGLKVLVH
jgi:hypothetical protein